MFSKAVLTLLIIGALWVNVLATPIPADWQHEYPPETPPPKYTVSDPSAHTTSNSNPGGPLYPPPASPPFHAPQETDPYAEAWRRNKKMALVAGGLITTALGIGIPLEVLGRLHKLKLKQNHTRRGFELESEDSNSVALLPDIKREPMPEDEDSHFLSSPPKLEPEPALPSL